VNVRQGRALVAAAEVCSTKGEIGLEPATDLDEVNDFISALWTDEYERWAERVAELASEDPERWRGDGMGLVAAARP
jgi:hypothetical protein